ncbi:putative bifunctional diguanylate cyclase/phosphodiesterase [Kaarinaea lacus]
MAFNLSRYFSISSLVGIVIVVAVLSFFYRHIATNTLIDHETRANLALTTAFANSIWPAYKDFVMSQGAVDRDTLLSKLELQALRQEVLSKMKNLNVVKVKIYNLDGITIFSTDAKQIGEDKSNNPGYLTAKAGKVISEITFRNEFYAFEDVIVDRNLLATYIPLQQNSNTPVEAVFELYSDVTDLVNKIETTQYQIVTGVLIALAILYLFLYLIVKRADNIIKRQEQVRMLHEQEMRHQAYHDSLTGLPNKSKFAKQLQESIDRSIRSGQLFALMFVDLDRFKIINDSMGHDAGDQLLRIAGERLISLTRDRDMLFRWGGDEFTVILENIDNLDDISAIAERILKGMSGPISIAKQELVISTSIGIAIYPTDSDTSETLIKNADAAMYHAKASGRNRFEFYTPEMNARAKERLELESGLQKALQNEEFTLQYQPKYDTSDQTLVGVEALLRWNHPNFGPVMPDRFIPALEENGLINSVGEWVLRTACAQNKMWQEQGYAPITVSVNISAVQFRSQQLIETVARVLDETQLNPRFLELELTESMFISNTEAAINTMYRLKELGVSLSIDDFGSGYSSLSYLKRFPVDYLKIDRCFIKDIENSNKDAAITNAIAVLAHSLNMKIVAEGVESQGQLDYLKSQGCHELQGFLFSRPVSAEEVGALLEKTSDTQQANLKSIK